jgi:hypothetical protein
VNKGFADPRLTTWPRYRCVSSTIGYHVFYIISSLVILFNYYYLFKTLDKKYYLKYTIRVDSFLINYKNI